MQSPIKVVIIGSGPAGFTAAIYAARAMLEPVMITGPSNGGQLMTTTEVENFPGYPDGITGPKMMDELEKQARKFGTRIAYDYVTGIETKERPFKILCGDGVLTANSIIISTGAEARWLHADGEEKLRSNGVSTCATCDGAFFKGEELLVIGGGDSAMEEAIFLTRYATKVTIIHRRKEFRASKIMLERAKDNDKIEWITHASVEKWLTDESGVLTGAKLSIQESSDSKKESREVSCGGAFIAIGHDPSTKFLGGQLDTDEDGYIINQHDMMTSVPGIFSCGDVCHSSRRYKQAITAAGEGCRAAMDCEKWLEDQNM